MEDAINYCDCGAEISWHELEYVGVCKECR